MPLFVISNARDIMPVAPKPPSPTHHRRGSGCWGCWGGAVHDLVLVSLRFQALPSGIFCATARQIVGLRPAPNRIVVITGSQNSSTASSFSNLWPFASRNGNFSDHLSIVFLPACAPHARQYCDCGVLDAPLHRSQAQSMVDFTPAVLPCAGRRSGARHEQRVLRVLVLAVRLAQFGVVGLQRFNQVGGGD